MTKRIMSMLVLLAAVATGAVAQSTYKVTVKEGTEDAAKWTITPAEATTTGVAAGTQVKATYAGTKKVKSVKAVLKKVNTTVTTAPTATAGYIIAGSTMALVSAGAADGGTMMYKVTTENTQPASTDGFSATVPTAEGCTASTYYVWYYVKADAYHTDSEISATAVAVTLAASAIWDSSNVSGIYVGPSSSYTKEGITLSANANKQYVLWQFTHIDFHVEGTGGYTFTAPTGKKFIKIEMTSGDNGWGNASLGTGWAFTKDGEIGKVTWTGTAASTVELLTEASSFGEGVTSIVFILLDD